MEKGRWDGRRLRLKDIQQQSGGRDAMSLGLTLMNSVHLFESLQLGELQRKRLHIADPEQASPAGRLIFCLGNKPSSP